MKKLVYLAALLVVAVVSFAFLPKADGPAQNMMLIGRCAGSGFGIHECHIITIAPDGQMQKQMLAVKGDFADKFTATHQAETAKLTELQTQGWRLKTTTSNVFGAIYLETLYVLEKN